VGNSLKMCWNISHLKSIAQISQLKCIGWATSLIFTVVYLHHESLRKTQTTQYVDMWIPFYWCSFLCHIEKCVKTNQRLWYLVKLLIYLSYCTVM